MSPDKRPNPARAIERVAVAFVDSWVADRGVVTNTGAGPGPDFQITYHDTRTAIGEVGWHEDPNIQSMWAHINQHSPTQRLILPDGIGQWSARLRAGARLTRLRHELPNLIVDLDRAGREHLDARTSLPTDALAERAARLGIDNVSRFSTREPSLVVYSPPGKGGFIPDDANIVCDWITEVVTDPRYLDMTTKLRHLHADERHIFIAAGSRTDMGVEERVRLIHERPPTTDPKVPEWISHAWVVSLFGSTAGLWTRQAGWTSVTLTDAELERLRNARQ